MKSNRILILLIGLIWGEIGHTQPHQPYQTNQIPDIVSGDNKPTNYKIGYLDPDGMSGEKGQLADYFIELLPGSSFTGSWYYYNSSTTGDTSIAYLVESPDVTWLMVSPTQFSDYGDGIATRVDFIFSTPSTPGTYSTVITDANGYWQDLFITLVVTTTPTLYISVFEEQVNINELFTWSNWTRCPAYFYFSDFNQYYYFSSMAVNHYEFPPESWFNLSPASFVLYPLDSTLVTFNATLISAGNDSILIYRSKQLYTWPYYFKFNFEVTEPSYINLSPDNQNVASAAGITTFLLESDTTWTVNDNASWLTITPTSGSNNATITATYAANNTTVQRIATITASATGVSTPATATVTQEPCSLTVTPSNQNVTYLSGSTHFSVNTLCLWTATSNKSWCNVTGFGVGNGTLTATYTSNSSPSSRTANITITIPGLSQVVVTVTQAGVPVPCTLSVFPTSHSVTSAAGSVFFSVTSNCSWTATCNQSWCTVNTSGVGNGTITATYTANPSPSPRTATITVTVTGANPVVATVTQAGSPGPPGWTPVPNLQFSMSVIGKIQLSPGAFSVNGNDIIGAFIGSECRGIANPNASMNGLIFLSIGSNSEFDSTVLFKVYLASTNEIININETMAFQSTGAIGTMENPYIFTFPMQNNVIIQDLTITSGQVPCFNAFQTITVAGGGANFLLTNGGVVNLIAG